MALKMGSEFWLFDKLWNAGAASTLILAPLMLDSGETVWIIASLIDSAVWSLTMMAVVNWENISLHINMHALRFCHDDIFVTDPSTLSYWQLNVNSIDNPILLNYL